MLYKVRRLSIGYTSTNRQSSREVPKMSLGNTALRDENITVETKNSQCFRDERCLFAPISEEVRVGASSK